MEGKSEIVEAKTFPFPAGFNWAVGPAMQRFIQALAGKKVMGAKCPSCGYTYVPPRSRCGKCNTAMEEKNLVDLSGRGTLMSYTKAHVRMDGNGNFQDLEKPMTIGAVKLDGADSLLFLPVEGVRAADLKEGLKVKIQWREETKGELADPAGAHAKPLGKAISYHFTFTSVHDVGLGRGAIDDELTDEHAETR